MPDIFRLQLLLATFAGWVNRHQAQAIEYLIEENRVRKERLGKKRLRLTDDQRRRLAAKGKDLGRRLLAGIATIVTPDTILRAHANVIAATDFFTAEVWTRRGPTTYYVLFVVHHATRSVHIAGIMTRLDSASWHRPRGTSRCSTMGAVREVGMPDQDDSVRRAIASPRP